MEVGAVILFRALAVTSGLNAVGKSCSRRDVVTSCPESCREMKNVKNDDVYKLGDEIGTNNGQSLVNHLLLNLEPEDELPVGKNK